MESSLYSYWLYAFFDIVFGKKKGDLVWVNHQNNTSPAACDFPGKRDCRGEARTVPRPL